MKKHEWTYRPKCYGLMILLWVILPGFSTAQTADDQYRVPLKEVLSEIEEVFEVRLNYSDKDVANRFLDYGFWRIRSYDLEKTLARVLFPLDLDFVKQAENEYRIKKFEYMRRSVEQGKRQLAYLSSLYSDEQQWENRKTELRNCIYQTLGLNDAPPAPQGKPIVTKKRKMNGYTVRNIAIETLPGLFVSGSLYEPVNLSGKAPVILNPNGHFEGGRYRPDMQYRCAALARMGAIAFNYDLFAWGESLLQFEKEDHRKSIAQIVQALNGMRILDYLLSLKQADPDRVAITGGSGGGSQTMILTALDPRIKVSAPVVMTSSHFDGGCPCESGVPIHLCGNSTNNAEIAAMASPRPQLIISVGKDWTHTVPELEFPFIQRIYGFYGDESLVQNVHFAEEGHDYGFSKRKPMYEFFAAQLGLDLEKIKNKAGEIDESKIVIEDEKALLVFGEDGKELPAHAIKNVEELYRLMNRKL